MILRRCQLCTHFYDKKRGRCPECGVEAFGFNKHLRTAQLNNHLYAAAERETRRTR